MKLVNPAEWQQFLLQFPESHILQTAQWGTLKEENGWTPYYVVGNDTAALVLLKKIIFGFNLAYIPKGPVGENWQELWDYLDRFCKQHHVAFLKVEPDIWERDQDTVVAKLAGFRKSPHCVQPRQTVVLSLLGEEDEWLQRMKQKTRYNIRLAQKKDVQIRRDDRVDIFNMLMHATGERDEFGIHADAYYRRAYDLFSKEDACALFTAYYRDEPLAGVMAFRRGKRAWYLYGASNEVERNRMPTYLVQWAAMQWAKQHACEEYDLWGIPDAPEDVLERDFTTRKDGLWGVYRFKRGFGGEIMRSVGAWDRVYNYPIYWAYLVYTRKNNS